MKQLIVLVGLPRSGKTTWARRRSEPIVSPDAIRLALYGQRFIALAEPYVWAIAQTMVRALFIAGAGTVIVDGTHNTQKRRDQWLSPEWATDFNYFNTSVTECVRRAVEEQDTDIIPVIYRMAREADWTDQYSQATESAAAVRVLP